MASGAAATAGAGAGAASLASRFAAFAASGPRIVLGTASSSRRVRPACAPRQPLLLPAVAVSAHA